MPCLEMNSEKSNAVGLDDVNLTHWYILWDFSVKVIFFKKKNQMQCRYKINPEDWVLLQV